MDAVDSDLGANANITYQLLGPNLNLFSIDTITGEIRVSSVGLDFETINPQGNPLEFRLFAQDAGKCYSVCILQIISGEHY